MNKYIYSIFIQLIIDEKLLKENKYKKNNY